MLAWYLRQCNGLGLHAALSVLASCWHISRGGLGYAVHGYGSGLGLHAAPPKLAQVYHMTDDCEGLRTAP